MTHGNIMLVLHAHLPFVRHPKYKHFLEENWLYEAISETYLPLLRVLRGFAEDNICAKITLSISPTLAAMLGDKLLQERYEQHLKDLIVLGDKELERNKGNKEVSALVLKYKNEYEQNLEDFTQRYQAQVLRAFALFQKQGMLEIITTAATHAFLPLYSSYPLAVNAQIESAVNCYLTHFNDTPKGLWLPECGYFPGIEEYLKRHHISYFFAAAHGLLYGENTPKHGVFAPVQCKNGVQVFGRDLASTKAVWSSEEGYPGDYSYREFYRDIGFELEKRELSPFIEEDDFRVYTGYKYYAITGNSEEKRIYNPEEAKVKVDEHAENFIYSRKKHTAKLSDIMDRPPLFVCPYDAELFGHWWYEGPQWIDSVVRKIHNDNEDNSLSMIHPSEYLEKYPNNQESTPAFSSWGNKGYAEVWLDGSNDWIYRHTHKLIERMTDLVRRYPDETGLKERALNQAAREVLLSQASDWPFIVNTGTTVPYAVKRVKEHIHNFTKIYDALSQNTVSTEWLTKIERKNNLFQEIDYRMFTPRGQDSLS
ncbi:MAG: glycoside hydrolase family 57 protein [Spirochaetia bacterium]